MMSSRERNSKSFSLVTLSKQVRQPQASAVLMVLGHWCDAWHHLSQLDQCCIVVFFAVVLLRLRTIAVLLLYLFLKSLIGLLGL